MTDRPAEPNPALIFETLNAHQRSAALKGAIELDLFTQIAQGRRTPAALAQACQADARALRILCDFLVVAGFLEKQGDEYQLAPTAAAFLDSRQPQYLGSLARFMHSPDLVNAFENIAEVVRRGGTLLPRRGTTATEYDGWVEFARSMAPLMAPAAQFLAEQAAQRLPGPIRVLDIAAGHGLFGISVARANPQARVTALDWPQVLAVAEENARQAGLADRYELLPGDAFDVDFGQGYDLVLVTNFLHHFDAAACTQIAQKIRGALADGGLAFTLEFVPNADRVSPPQPATFAFTMLGTTPAGDAYIFDEYDSMFRAAGLGASEMLDVPQSVQRVIITRR